MPETAPETREHTRASVCQDCAHEYLLHQGGCKTAKRIAQLLDSLTDAHFVLAMIVKALEDSKEIDLNDSGEYETKLVREARKVLGET